MKGFLIIRDKHGTSILDLQHYDSLEIRKHGNSGSHIYISGKGMPSKSFFWYEEDENEFERLKDMFERLIFSSEENDIPVIKLERISNADN